MKLRTLSKNSSILTSLLFAFIQSSFAQQSSTVPLYDDLGDHHFPISSTTNLVQEYFDQGMRLYYAFNHAEAIRAFRKAQELDSNCGICFWGESLAWGPNINLPMDEVAAAEALKSAEEAAKRIAAASEKEQSLITAIQSRYSNHSLEDREALDRQYATELAKIVAAYSEDIDIRVLYAESLMNLRPWDYWQEDGTPAEGMDKALGHLEYAMKEDSNHPGACHFYIHAVEAIYPERALPCAERLADLMPGAGHLVHMPGHIYIRVGRYLDAVAANEHAVHADETYILDQHPGMGMYTAGYYPHNYDFMAFAAMMIGRSELSVSSAQKVTSLLPAELFGSPGMDFLQHWTARPMLMQVRFGHWEDILTVAKPTSDKPHSQALWHYARGRAFAAQNKIANAKSELDSLRAIAALPTIKSLKMEFNSSEDLLAIAEKVLSSWIEAKNGNPTLAVSIMEQAVELEDNLFYGEPPEWSVPTRQDLGAVLLLANQPEKAEFIFNEDLNQFPENGWSLYGLSQALKLQQKNDDAAAIDSIFNRVWQDSYINIESIF